MKTYKKNFLPDTIVYNGIELKLNAYLSASMIASGTPIKTISKELKKQDRVAVLVLVLPKTLKGRTDLHGNPYQPTKHIFSN